MTSPLAATTAITATVLLTAIGVCTIILKLARTTPMLKPVTDLTPQHLNIYPDLTPQHLNNSLDLISQHLTNSLDLTPQRLNNSQDLTPQHLNNSQDLTPQHLNDSPGLTPQHLTTSPNISTTSKPPSSKLSPKMHKDQHIKLCKHELRRKNAKSSRSSHFRRKGRRKPTRKGSDATGGRRRRRQKRIVQGEDAVRGRYPWMVMVLVKGKFVCGGSIIHSTHVLTAAHCLRPRYRPSSREESFSTFYNASDVEIIAGKHYYVIDSGGSDVMSEQRVSVRKVIPHENFDDTKTVAKYYDLAILKLQHGLQWTDWVSPICLPRPRKKVHLPAHALLLGWGSIHPRYRLNWIPKFPQVLQQLRMKLHSRKKCRRHLNFYYVKYMSHRQLCAVTVKDGISSACNGDSGGPLFIQDTDGQHVQLGVLSWGYCEAQPGVPSFFTYLPRFVPWIERVTAG